MKQPHVALLYILAGITLGFLIVDPAPEILGAFTTIFGAIAWRWYLDPKPTTRFSSKEAAETAEALENLSKELFTTNSNLASLQIKLGFQKPNLGTGGHR